MEQSQVHSQFTVIILYIYNDSLIQSSLHNLVHRVTSSSVFPVSGVHHFCCCFVVFFCAYVSVFFFNPTIEEVKFCLCELCMLGVFLLLAFTRLGHECQNLLSLCNGMHVCTD